MEHQQISVLSFSYGRHLFDAENPESKRMQRSAAFFESLHAIVFTLREDAQSRVVFGNLTLYPTNSRNKFLYLFDALRIGWRILRDHTKRWVVVAQDPFELGLMGLMLSWWYRLPLSVQEHGDFYSRPYWRQERFSNALRSVVGMFVLRQADTVRVVSERIARALRERGVAAERIFKLPVRTDVFDVPAVFDVGTEPAPEGGITVLTMARLVPQKNLPLLIDAFAQAVHAVPNARLLIIGKGPLESFLRARVDFRGISSKVTFLPWTENPQQYLRTAHVYALSSDWEGWARVLIEAMREGVPTVTTDVGCASEVLKDNVHGFVVPPRDEDAFAHALTTLLADPELRTRLGAQARRDATSVHQSAEAYAAAQARILAATYRVAQRS